MARDFLSYDLDQPFLLPPDLREWLPEGHLARFLLDVIEELDLSEIVGRARARDPRGRSAYDPRMLTALLLYAYCVGRPSSRKIERATYEEVPFRVLAGNRHPDHDTIASFRKRHLVALSRLFLQVLRLCQAAGLVKLGHVALDGTKVEANASKHKAMSYERMLKSEAELAEEIERLLTEAEAVDSEEDDRYGSGQRGDELPTELARRESRLVKIRAAKEALEAEAAARRVQDVEEAIEQAEAEESEAPEGESDQSAKRLRRLEGKRERAVAHAEATARAHGQPLPEVGPRDPEAWPNHRIRSTMHGTPEPRAQRNFTDPDSRIMKSHGSYLQAYNCQAAVDAESQVIVATAVTNQAPDVEHLRPMLHEMEATCGGLPETLTADAGYWSEANALACQDRGVDAYLATSRDKHGDAPAASSPSDDPDARERMRHKLATADGRQIYARRKAIVEPVFGQIKEARGYRRFLLRGQRAVSGEWSLIALTHNLLKLHRSGWKPVPAG